MREESLAPLSISISVVQDLVSLFMVVLRDLFFFIFQNVITYRAPEHILHNGPRADNFVQGVLNLDPSLDPNFPLTLNPTPP